ncbi:MAG: glycine--tRNA ligase subunit beta [candidate division WOR-3 bacterium]
MKIANTQKATLLVELGTEELPASFLNTTAQQLQRNLLDFFSKNRISYGESVYYYTPRRLSVIIKDVAFRQAIQVVEIQGPPRKFAFDEQGKPTQVAYGFVRSHNASIKDLYSKNTEKGEYLFLKKTVPSKSIIELLRENFKDILLSIECPKVMKWLTDSNLIFARPIRWLTLVYGSRLIPVKLDNIQSIRYSYGHRNYKSKKVLITKADRYPQLLKRAGVIVSPQERQRLIVKRLNELALKINGKVVDDQELLEEATNTCEFPNLVVCKFDHKYLSLPEVVLTTTLKKHLRAFAVKSADDKSLLPYFIVVTNNPSCNSKIVRHWYEEAAKARLDDAKFYFEEDLKIELEKLVENEKDVIWIEGLGSLFDKTKRLEKLVLVIGQSISGVNLKALLRAAYLSKADLLTNMVREKEYTSLQGMMGGVYSLRGGEDELVSQIIAEHYLPQFSTDTVPRTVEGAILSIADKIDNIVGVFMINEIPSGSADKFGIRRQANAIFTICVDKKLFIDFEPVIELNISYFNLYEKPQELVDKIISFLKDRLKSLFVEKKIGYDIINAVLTLPGLNPYDFYLRCQALSQLRASKDFERLIIEQKRVNNILKDCTSIYIVNQGLFKEPEEIKLYNAAQKIKDELDFLVNKREYVRALELLLTLRDYIDDFFDKVLVMTDDTVIRENRLALLQDIRSLFQKVADLSEIVIS